MVQTLGSAPSTRQGTEQQERSEHDHWARNVAAVTFPPNRKQQIIL